MRNHFGHNRWQLHGDLPLTNEIEIGPCDVCYLLDGDERQKPVEWCERCQAWICDGCRPRTFRRFLAMWKRRLIGAKI